MAPPSSRRATVAGTAIAFVVTACVACVPPQHAGTPAEAVAVDSDGSPDTEAPADAPKVSQRVVTHGPPPPMVLPAGYVPFKIHVAARVAEPFARFVTWSCEGTTADHAKTLEPPVAENLATFYSRRLVTAGFRVVPEDQADAVLRLETFWTVSCEETTDGNKKHIKRSNDQAQAGKLTARSGEPLAFFDSGPRGAASFDAMMTSPPVVAFASAVGGTDRTAATAPRAPADERPAAASAARASTEVLGAAQRTSYALIIGVETYRDLPAPTGADADAKRYARLVTTTLGLPDKNVRVLRNERAAKSDIEKELRWLQNSVPAGGRAYLFYSGHGAPDPSTGTPYLVPYDGDPSALEDTALTMAAVLGSLQSTKGRDALAVVDACFSGSGGRSVLPKGARPLVVVRDAQPTAKLALFTSARGSEISGPSPSGEGGLFSQIFAEGLGSAQADGDGDGQISLAELHAWVEPRVSRTARQDRRDQHPTLVLGGGAGAAADFVVAHGVAR